MTRPLSGELLVAKLKARRGIDCEYLFKRKDCSWFRIANSEAIAAWRILCGAIHSRLCKWPRITHHPICQPAWMGGCALQYLRNQLIGVDFMCRRGISSSSRPNDWGFVRQSSPWGPVLFFWPFFQSALWAGSQ